MSHEALAPADDGSPRAIFVRCLKSEHANPSPDPRAAIARKGGGPATCARA